MTARPPNVAAVLLSGLWLSFTIYTAGYLVIAGALQGESFMWFDVSSPTAAELRRGPLYIAAGGVFFVAGPAALYWWWRNKLWLALTVITGIISGLVVGAAVINAFL